MIAYLAAFSPQGKQLAERIKKLSLSLQYGKVYSRYGGHCACGQMIWHMRGEQSSGAWLQEAFAGGFPVILVGALGIAVRMIAPYLKSKVIDSPVLVLDEGGKYVIPVLSGHLGGANELAGMIAKELGATAVVTTATDVHGLFAVDVFARRNGLHICNPQNIRYVSGKLLRGEPVTMTVDPVCMTQEQAADLHTPEEVHLVLWNPSHENKVPDIVITPEPPQAGAQQNALYLSPKMVVLGMGCRKNKSYIEIKQFVYSLMQREKVKPDQIFALASVEAKENEAGLQMLAQKLRIPFVVFSPEELKNVPGEFASSGFVAQTIGVDNVCERAAAAAANGGKLILQKQAADGMTAALAKREQITLSFD